MKENKSRWETLFEENTEMSSRILNNYSDEYVESLENFIDTLKNNYIPLEK